MRDLARGAGVGLLCAVPVMVVGGNFSGWYVPYALVLGAVLAMARSHWHGNAATAVSGGVLIGVLGWLLVPLTLDPLVYGDGPTWSAIAVRMMYPDLFADVLHGAATGLALAFLPVRERVRDTREVVRVVIVGGGFGGVGAAQRFERLAIRGLPVDVTLISDSNFLLFTPMLAEAASGALDATHISAPVRAALSHTRFRNGRVRKFDTEAKAVQVEDELIPYDHLVLATGSVPHSFGLPGVAEHAWTLKSLRDATRLRDHVIGLLERADGEPCSGRRRRMLTFVVAGAGFAGTEVVAELFDLVHRVRHYFPGIGVDDPRFVLVHPGERILPEMPPELAGYALDRLEARGIEIRLGVRVAEAGTDWVRVTGGDEIATATFIWTAGNRPGELLGGTQVPTDSRLRAEGLERVWAVGDCARVPERAGGYCPPTAQHALRQGKVVAENIAAVVRGREPAEFRFRTIGLFVALGHRTAAADLRGHRFSGLAAWFLWRGVYLAKLPGVDKRLRVLFDWTLDLVFPRDIVLTGADAVNR